MGAPFIGQKNTFVSDFGTRNGIRGGSGSPVAAMVLDVTAEFDTGKNSI